MNVMKLIIGKKVQSFARGDNNLLLNNKRYDKAVTNETVIKMKIK